MSTIEDICVVCVYKQSLRCLQSETICRVNSYTLVGQRGNYCQMILGREGKRLFPPGFPSHFSVFETHVP